MPTDNTPAKIATFPSTSSTSNPPDSEITGPRQLAPTLASAIGQLLGATGADARQSVRTGLPTAPAIAATAVPEGAWKIDHVAHLPSQLQSLLARPVYRDCYGDSGWNGYPERFALPAKISDDERRAAQKALGIYRAACAPLDPVSLSYELAVVRERTARRRSEDGDWDVELDSLVDDLAPYPADMVIDVLRDWRRTEKWWPLFSELAAQLDRKVARRRAIIRALEEATNAR